MSTVPALPITQYALAWTALAQWLSDNQALFSEQAYEILARDIIVASSEIHPGRTLTEQTRDVELALSNLQTHGLANLQRSDDCAADAMSFVRELRLRLELTAFTARRIQLIVDTANRFPR